jgi:hypothetical protein
MSLSCNSHTKFKLHNVVSINRFWCGSTLENVLISQGTAEHTLLISCMYIAIKKSGNPFLTHVLFVKNKLHWNDKTKQCCIKCWKCPRSPMHAFTLFLMSDATWWRVSAVTFEMHSSIFCFNSSYVCGLFLYTLSFKNPQRHRRNPVEWDPVIEGARILKSFSLIRFLEFVHDMYTIRMKFKSLCRLMYASVG